MTSSRAGLLSRLIADVPVAVLDFETTGMFPGADRVVEVAVARVEPGREPELVLDTLVQPGRRMACTHVHGITDRDVADAPRFEAVAGRVLRAVEGCVIAAYNVSFDLRFLEYELGRSGVRHPFPHLCLMYMRPMLGLGPRCKLAAACRAHGITHSWAHAAAADTLAAAGLWVTYRKAIADLGVNTFADLAARKSYQFTRSFVRDPHPRIESRGDADVALKSRRPAPRPGLADVTARREAVPGGTASRFASASRPVSPSTGSSSAGSPPA